MRGLLFVIAAIVGSLVWEARAEQPAQSGISSADVSLDQLLPRKGRSKVCYSGTFEKQTIEIEDWSKPTTEPVPGVFRFGEQVMRPKPLALPDQEISSVTLELTNENYAANYGWIYDFTLRVGAVQLGKSLFAWGNCPWTPIGAKDWKDEVVTRHGVVLGCGIECDGGSMSVERDLGTDDLLLRFDGEVGGLRMSPGCNGGAYRVGTGDRDSATAFRLKKVKRSECRPLERWRESE